MRAGGGFLDLEGGQALRQRIPRVGPGHQRGQQHRIAGVARERTDGVQRGRQRHRAMKADQPARGLQARDAVQRGGNPHRATRVRPQRGRREAGRDSHARSAGRAARRMGEP
ncbi:hypothetical protein G6F65_019746 [Rhizopus arrhizus]|nr:hypothetical protein G6F65_019746 [Rhizopus arrhizus]